MCVQLCCFTSTRWPTLVLQEYNDNTYLAENDTELSVEQRGHPCSQRRDHEDGPALLRF